MHYSLKTFTSSYEFDIRKTTGIIENIEKKTLNFSNGYNRISSRIYFTNDYIDLENCDFIGKVGDEVIVIYVCGNNIQKPIIISNTTLNVAYEVMSFEHFTSCVLRLKTSNFALHFSLLFFGLIFSAGLLFLLKKLNVWPFFIFTAMLFPFLFLFFGALKPLASGLYNIVFRAGTFVYEKDIYRTRSLINNEIDGFGNKKPNEYNIHIW